MKKLVLSALAILMIGCGGSGSDDNSWEVKSEKIQGKLLDAPVVGAKYESKSSSGTTDNDGKFSCRLYEEITFYAGDIKLGTTGCKEIITPLELADQDIETAINIAYFLQNIDSDHNLDDGINIPENLSLMNKSVATTKDINFKNFEEVDQLLNELGIVNKISPQEAWNNFVNSISKEGYYIPSNYLYPNFPQVDNQIDDQNVFNISNTISSNPTPTVQQPTSSNNTSNISVNISPESKTLFPGHTLGSWANERAFAALRKDGTVVTWGDPEYGGDSSAVADKLVNVSKIFSNEEAFIALKNDGTLVGWGNKEYGADFSEIENELHDVVNVYSTIDAFTALRKDGTAISWWWYDGGSGESKFEYNIVDDVKDVFSTLGAFAILKKDGTVVTWGDSSSGGMVGDVRDELKNVIKVYSTESAFAALRQDGTVVTWGDVEYGADSSSVKDELHDIVKIFSNYDAFAALRKDGTVVTWGYEDSGGDSSSVKDELHDVVAIYSTDGAFAALRKDGTVVTWGDDFDGADSSNVKDELHDVVKIFATGGSFAALRKDGTVVTWGDINLFNNVQVDLTNIKYVYATNSAFAALKDDNTVVSWGNIYYESMALKPYTDLKDIVSISSNVGAFAAIKKDGTVVTWGLPDDGADSSKVKDQLKGVKEISPHYTY